MIVQFTKYQGTGNDFIMIDQRNQTFIDHNNTTLIDKLCDRKFGIGADGLILLENSAISDFRMVYFNADGRQSTMCGNGGRCLIHFAWKLGIFVSETNFEAIDGLHTGKILDEQMVSLQMCDVSQIEVVEEKSTFVLNTGSPHYVKIDHTIPTDIKTNGSAIRYSDAYKMEGINVNFVTIMADQNKIEVATYERGVEDETLSCGTGVTAAAISAKLVSDQLTLPIDVLTKGGNLSVYFDKNEDHYTNIWLTGPAVEVFKGVLMC